MRVFTVFDDLLLGSNVLGMLRAEGYDASLVGPEASLDDAAVVIVDLGAASFDGVALGEGLRARTIGVYSHVDAETRARAERAGFDLVVPRSRFAREGAALVARLLEA